MCKFIYVRDVAGTHGELTIYPINARIETRENFASIKPQLVSVQKEISRSPSMRVQHTKF